MEIIHDVAPGATLAFHTAFDGQADFAQGILDLKKAGAKVIVDDVGYIDEPMFQDGNHRPGGGQGRRPPRRVLLGGRQRRPPVLPEPLPAKRKVRRGGTDLFCEAHDFDPGSKVDVRQRIRLPAGGLLNGLSNGISPSSRAAVRPAQLATSTSWSSMRQGTLYREVPVPLRAVIPWSSSSFRTWAAAAFKITITNCSVGANTQPTIPLLLT